MKRFLALSLVLVMVLLSVVSCGTFDYDKADYSKLIELADHKAITTEELQKSLEAYREDLSKSYTSFNVTVGYKMDFYVKAIVLDSYESTEGVVLDKWTFEETKMVENYYVGKEARNEKFDDAIIYQISKVGDKLVTFREVKVGEPFSFLWKFADDFEDKDVAGKVVEFTIKAKAIYPAVYEDNDIVIGFSQVLPTMAKDTVVKMGDILNLSYVGKIDGKEFDGGSFDNYVMVLGKANFIEGFEEAIVGHKVGEKFAIDIKFPDNYGATDLAGKPVTFEIEIHSGNEFTEEAVKALGYNSVFEAKEAMRVQYHAMYTILDAMAETVTVKSYPSSLMKQYTKIYTDRAKDYVQYYYDQYYKANGYTMSQVESLIFGKEGLKGYAKTQAEKLVAKDLVASSLLKEFNVEFGEKEYKAYLEVVAASLSYQNGMELSPEQVESDYGVEIITVEGKSSLVTKYIYESMTGLPFGNKVAYIDLT